MYICVHIYICVIICIHMYVCILHVLACVCVYIIFLSTCMYLYYMYLYVYMQTTVHTQNAHFTYYMCQHMYVFILYSFTCIHLYYMYPYVNINTHTECSFHLLYVSTYVCIHITFIHIYTSILCVSVCKHQHTRGMLISFIICISTCMYLYYILILYSSTCIYFYYMYPNLNNSTHTECSFHLSYVPAYVCIYMIFMHMYLFCISKFKQQRTRGMLISLVLVFVVGIAGKISEKCNLQSYYIVNLVADRLLRISSTGLRDGHRR